MHTLHALVLSCTLGLLAAGCSPDPDAPEVWRFAIEETAGSVQHHYATRFAERIEEGTDGEVEVKVYTYGTLGTSDQITELLHNGSLQFAMSSPGHLGKLIPEVQALLLHFVFSDDDAINRQVLSDPELLDTFDALYADKGLALQAIYPEGWMAWTTNRPVRTPEDFEGIKIRVMTTPLLLSLYEAYGASPTPLAYSEVYSALQLSMIDAQVNPVFAIQEMSFHEVTDFLVFPDHALFVTTAAAHRPFYEGLSEDRRALVDDTFEALQDEIFDHQAALEDTRLARIRKTRPDLEVIRLTDAEREAFRTRAAPVREQFLAMAPQGQQVLDVLDRTLAEARAAHGERSSDEAPSPDPSEPPTPDEVEDDG